MQKNRQQGVALVIALLFLLVVTIISVTAARNSSFSLQFSSNVQDQNDSFQAAEAALYATIALAETADDPFTRNVVVDPFDGLDALDGLNDPNSVTASLRLMSTDNTCPRPPANRGGSSVGTFECDFYQVNAEHTVPRRARTQASLGIVKPLLGAGS